jgi:hypothetical protein|tara:strand:- start:171 stop:416 length:246 start_codon:yes stop_codon:yes gene_type:complete
LHCASNTVLFNKSIPCATARGETHVTTSALELVAATCFEDECATSSVHAFYLTSSYGNITGGAQLNDLVGYNEFKRRPRRV